MLHAMPLLLLAFLPCSLNSDAEVAALRLRVELPPVPAYSPDGKIPAELKDRFVFLDEDSGDLACLFHRALILRISNWGKIHKRPGSRQQ